jgi:hypothetical protein
VEGCPSLPAGNDYCDCRKSGAWLTETGAKRKLKSIQKKDSTRRKSPVRAYECEQGIFHLTSQERS